MIRTLERVGDRLLSLTVPRTAAIAQTGCAQQSRCSTICTVINWSGERQVRNCCSGICTSWVRTGTCCG